MTTDSFVPTALILGSAAAVVCLVCVVYFALENSGSRNIALATGTLAAAIVMYGLQLLFELQSTTSTELFTAQFTIDRATPSIDGGADASSNLSRYRYETGASNTFAAENPGQFDGDRQKLFRDFALFSIIAYLGTEQFDWQIKRVSFKTAVMAIENIEYQSKPSECNAISKSDVHAALARARNAFASAEPFAQERLCLPPSTEFKVSDGELVLSNPFCDITFRIEPSGTVFYGVPGEGFRVELLPNDQGRFEVTPINIRVTAQFHALRVQHRKARKYREWAERLTNGLGNWFEPPSGVLKSE
jgi:hypothetical protein